MLKMIISAEKHKHTTFIFRTIACYCLFAGFLFLNGCSNHKKNQSFAIPQNGSDQSDKYKVYIIEKGTLRSIKESSGLVYTDGILYTHEDAGNDPKIYSIDTINGEILQTIVIDNYQNVDWEDITADNGFIYIGDFGNNDGNRKNLRVLKIAKSDIGNEPFEHVFAHAIDFSYKNQHSFALDKQTDFDCESIVSIGDSLFLFSKDRGDYKTKVYALPKTQGNYQLTPCFTYNVGGLVTGADYDATSKRLILIGYETTKLNSFLVCVDGFKTNRFNSKWRKIIIGNNHTEWMTEGVCFSDSNHLFISCESTSKISSNLYSLNLHDLLANNR